MQVKSDSSSPATPTKSPASKSAAKSKPGPKKQGSAKRELAPAPAGAAMPPLNAFQLYLKDAQLIYKVLLG